MVQHKILYCIPDHNTMGCKILVSKVNFTCDDRYKKPSDIWKADKEENVLQVLKISHHMLSSRGQCAQAKTRRAGLVTEEEEWRTQCTARLTRVVSP